MKSFINTFFKRPPILFPLVAVFYVLFSLYMMEEWWLQPYAWLYRFKPVLFILYALLWTVATCYRKWGAIGFVMLTSLHAAFVFFVASDHLEWGISRIWADSFYYYLILLNLILSGFILFYFRRIAEGKKVEAAVK